MFGGSQSQPMSLTAPAISQWSVEVAAKNLWMEWLAKYFDGAAHVIGPDAVTFPRADLAWATGEPKQPMADKGNAVEIRVIMIPRSEMIDSEKNILFDGKRITEAVLFNLQIAAKHQGKGQSQILAMTVADLLAGLLRNPDTRFDLSERGIYNLRPLAGTDFTTKDYAIRYLPCRAELQYGITFGTGVATPPDAAEQAAAFFREAPFVNGEYLVGTYQWSASMKVKYALASGLAPQGGDAMVELELGGTLTGVQLTLGAGAALSPKTDFKQPVGLLVPASTTARWKIVSGPEGAAGAWRASVVMNVEPNI